MKIKEIHKRITKIIKILEVNPNQEKHENLENPCENFKKHEPRNPCENYENNENLRNQLDNHKNHEHHINPKR